MDTMEFIIFLTIATAFFIWLFGGEKDKKGIELFCAGCGEKIENKEDEKAIIITGVDGIKRLVHFKEECTKRVWNGYIFGKNEENKLA